MLGGTKGSPCNPARQIYNKHIIKFLREIKKLHLKYNIKVVYLVVPVCKGVAASLLIEMGTKYSIINYNLHYYSQEFFLPYQIILIFLHHFKWH